MSLSDFTIRLKKMAKEEYKIAKLETRVAHKNVVLFKHIDGINIVSKKHEQSIQLCAQKVTDMYQKINLLNKLIEEESKLLVNLEDTVQQLQNQYNGKYNKTVGERHQMLMESSLLRFFEDATKTYVNKECLPKIVQGVKINNNKWIPFQKNNFNYSSPHLNYWRSIILRNSTSINRTAPL